MFPVYKSLLLGGTPLQLFFFLSSEAFAVDDAGTTLVEFGLRDPHRVEGGERGMDGTTKPG